MTRSLDILFPYSAETRDIVVRVAVSFMPEQSDPRRGRWFWSYHIRIENRRAEEVQLLSRRWVISDGFGQKHLVEGEGVVGAQPLIRPGDHYGYVSGCPLETPMGTMEGSYTMIDSAGTRFAARIPQFVLAEPVAIQ